MVSVADSITACGQSPAKTPWPSSKKPKPTERGGVRTKQFFFFSELSPKNWQGLPPPQLSTSDTQAVQIFFENFKCEGGNFGN